jgi:hypothetical protein
MKQWSEVITQQGYINATPEDREAVKREYFQAVIRPQITNETDITPVWDEFYAHTRSLEPKAQPKQTEAMRIAKELIPAFGETLISQAGTMAGGLLGAAGGVREYGEALLRGQGAKEAYSRAQAEQERVGNLLKYEPSTQLGKEASEYAEKIWAVPGQLASKVMSYVPIEQEYKYLPELAAQILAYHGAGKSLGAPAAAREALNVKTLVPESIPAPARGVRPTQRSQYSPELAARIKATQEAPLALPMPKGRGEDFVMVPEENVRRIAELNQLQQEAALGSGELPKGTTGIPEEQARHTRAIAEQEILKGQQEAEMEAYGILAETPMTEKLQKVITNLRTKGLDDTSIEAVLQDKGINVNLKTAKKVEAPKAVTEEAVPQVTKPVAAIRIDGKVYKRTSQSSPNDHRTILDDHPEILETLRANKNAQVESGWIDKGKFVEKPVVEAVKPEIVETQPVQEKISPKPVTKHYNQPFVDSIHSKIDKIKTDYAKGIGDRKWEPKAVKRFYEEDLKPLFSGKGAEWIKARISASKAETFDELKVAISKLIPTEKVTKIPEVKVSPKVEQTKEIIKPVVKEPVVDIEQQAIKFGDNLVTEKPPIDTTKIYKWYDIDKAIEDAPDVTPRVQVKKVGSRWEVSYPEKTHAATQPGVKPMEYETTKTSRYATKQEAMDAAAIEMANTGKYGPEVGQVTIKSPNGATYKIWNTKEQLNDFKARVNKEFRGKSIELYSGVDPTQIVKVIRGLKGNIQEAMPHLENLGSRIYESGVKKFSDWAVKMRDYLQDLYPTFKPTLKQIWDRLIKPLKGEVGAVGDVSMVKSRLAIKAEARRLEDAFKKDEGIAEYQKTEGFMKLQAERAIEIIEKDIEFAEKIATQKVSPPEGVTAESMYKYLEIHASTTGNDGLLYRLARSKAPTMASEIGQRMKSLDVRTEDSPLEAASQVIKEREARAERIGKKQPTKKLNDDIDELDKKIDEKGKELETHRIKKRNPALKGTEERLKKRIEEAEEGFKAEGVSEKDFLKNEYDNIFGREVSESKRIELAIKSVQKSIAEYNRRIMEEDFSVKKREELHSEKLDALKAERAKLVKEYNALKKSRGPKKSALDKWKAYRLRKIKEIEEQFATGNFKKPVKEDPTLDAEGQKIKREYDTLLEQRRGVASLGSITKREMEILTNLSSIMRRKRDLLEKGGNRREYGMAKALYEEYVADLKGDNRPLLEMLIDRKQEFMKEFGEHKAGAVGNLLLDTCIKLNDLSISLVATLDNSFIGRQGINVLFTHPTVWFPNAVKSFTDIAKVIGGKNARRALMSDIYARENYLNGEYNRAKIFTKHEEQFPTRLPERVPVLGRLFKASETAFSNSGTRMRADLYDLYKKIGTENKVKWDELQVKEVGKLVNSMTARGEISKTGKVDAALRVVIWAPKMLKANWDVLTGHTLSYGLKTNFVRKQAGMNLVKIVGGTALVLAISDALQPGSVEKDPTSALFGKLKFGQETFDITGGKAGLITLAFRMWNNLEKQARTGLVKEYGPGFGQNTRFSKFIDFVVGKSTPPAHMVIDWMKEKYFDQQPFDVKRSLYGATTPIIAQKVKELDKDAPVESLVGVIADAIGVSATTYKPLSEIEKVDIKQKKEDYEKLQKAKSLYGRISKKFAEGDFAGGNELLFKIEAVDEEMGKKIRKLHRDTLLTPDDRKLENLTIRDGERAEAILNTINSVDKPMTIEEQAAYITHLLEVDLIPDSVWGQLDDHISDELYNAIQSGQNASQN